MHKIKRANAAVHWYTNELTSRVVAESGRAEDRFHLGKLVLQGLKDAPDFVLQIDGGTGKSETCGSVLERSVKCANALRALGLQRGDVMILMAPNHLELAIPYYAALYLGLNIAPIDRFLQIRELEDVFSKDEPKIVFCQSEKARDVNSALNNCKVDAKVIHFDESKEQIDNSMSFDDLLKKYGSEYAVSDFKPTDFDPEDTTAMLISTSGTTGLPKQAVITHKNFAISGLYIWMKNTKFPSPIRMNFIVSPLQWLSAILNFNMSPIYRYTRLQTSLTLDQDHAYHLINTYKPDFLIISPTLLATLIRPGDRERCDFTSIELILTGGSAVSANLLDEMMLISPNTEICNIFGMSELSCMAFMCETVPRGTCGKPAPFLQVRLVDVDTQTDIVEPNQPGELWLKGPSVFQGYYKNPEATKAAFAEDGWLKSGDMFYRDENWNFFFVERIKMLLKYRNHQISPVEIQNVIRQHPGVSDVAVTAISDLECGDLPVACIVRHPGYNVTAQEIKDLVKESLTDSKQLRGGVIFLDAIPVTATTKIDFRKLKEMVIHMKKE